MMKTLHIILGLFLITAAAAAEIAAVAVATAIQAEPETETVADTLADTLAVEGAEAAPAAAEPPAPETLLFLEIHRALSENFGTAAFSTEEWAQAFAAMLTAFESGIELETAAGESALKTAAVGSTLSSGMEGVALYLRITCLNTESGTALPETLASYSEYKGVILDLRATASGTESGLNAAFSALAKVELPVIAFVSSDTAGFAEKLLRRLKGTCDLIIVGAPTAGRAHKLKPRQLANGLVLLLPESVAETEVRGRLSLVPDIQVTPEDLNRDKLISQAQDILKVIQAFEMPSDTTEP